jgi:5-hydroxyisourate hydrolase-like protein (transthyretin family)
MRREKALKTGLTINERGKPRLDLQILLIRRASNTEKQVIQHQTKQENKVSTTISKQPSAHSQEK